MVDEDDFCDLTVAYGYFLCKIDSTKKRKQRKKHGKRFWIYEAICLLCDFNL